MATLSYAEIDAICANYKHHLARWARDPVAFCMEAFHPDKQKPPQYWQAEFFWALARKKKAARAAGHGCGKSFCLGIAPWWLMICHKKLGEPLKVPCTGPSGNNIEDVLWSEIQAAYGRLHPILQAEFVVQKDTAFHVSKLERSGIFDPDDAASDADAWFARLRTARKENPEALQGFHGNPSLFIVDEAVGVPDEVFQVMRGAMSDPHSYGIMFANPRRLSGYFHKSAHSKKSMWDFGHINCEEHTVDHVRKYHYFDAFGRRRPVEVAGRVSKQYIEEMREEFGENSATYAYRVKGQFPKSEDDSLISPELISDALARKGDEKPDYERKRTPRYMGVDIAYTGKDFSALVVRCGNEIEHVETWHGYDPSESTDRVAAAYKDFEDSGLPITGIFVDDIGYGAGVTSSLRRRKLPAIPVVVSQSMPEMGGTRCDKLRDWLWWQCRLFFQRRRPCFTHPEGAGVERLCEELQMPRYGRTESKGEIKVESKDQMRNRLQRSPDVADALCLTFYREQIDKLDPAMSASEIHAMRLQQKKKKHRRKKKKITTERWKVV